MTFERRRLQIAKFLDARIGSILVGLAARLRLNRLEKPPRDVRNVLFVKFWGLGSIILTEPAIRAIRKCGLRTAPPEGPPAA